MKYSYKELLDLLRDAEREIVPLTFGSNWYNQREKALERDNFSCQICNSETNLHVNHDTQRSTYRDSEVFDVSKSNKLENLHSLCEDCHYAVHSSEKNVPEQRKSSLAPRVVQ